MSSSKPGTASTPEVEVGGQNAESVVQSSTEGRDGGTQTRRDGGTQTRREGCTLTRPPLHPRSKKRKSESPDQATPSQLHLQVMKKRMTLTRMTQLKVITKNLLDLDLGLGITSLKIRSPNHHILGLHVIGVGLLMHVTLIEMVQLI
ncbi:hypothetical protein PIB30_090214 [Stylosanthes scabra]|uniref:Uncharacterized protein n=1 Tax=Stylosanthes scabra TaxID=79078 RepID=A0ABU6WSK9_9FABA|nr:hypothetical protein [Stylosanthes scabra]